MMNEVVLGSASRTTNGAKGFANSARKLALILDVTAFSGTTPTLDVAVNGIDPASGEKVLLKSFTQAVGNGTEAIYIGLDADTVVPFRKMEVAWTLGGTNPDFTFSIGASGL